ncbi:DUF2599 domain-containing protein [Pseudomonas sp. MAFF 302030]|uniref:DUF2599 domain-containing protein n=1 Tax=Pseudomonas morbosilactucae TaxID=2938197 RepID=A0A9X2C5L1_9PSED|nr:DUF2599 domain-containing protein [Pseudomonas morbosilactucae]MCK9798337.1 DUF2599 domain-containing protein [Pseudomonas morbosilactucae]
MNLKPTPITWAIALAGLSCLGTAQADQGSDTVARLHQLYNDTRQDCGGPSKPAFLCSGVLFRATWPSTDYQFYSVSPKSQASGGVSASYLRKDSKFRKLAYGLQSGFIFDTIFGNPKDHQDYAVLCSFPIDAATDDRQQQGCTDSRRTPGSVEKYCHEIGVTTAEQWGANYRQNGGDHSRQCSFDVRDERNSAAGPAFYQSIRSMAQISAESFTTQNELRLAKWEENPPKSPSILALFYAEDPGLEGARLNQIQWYKAVQQYLPVINMKLPQTPQQDASFAYDSKKQVIYPITEKNSCERYVQSATWVDRHDPGFGRNVMTLEVTPTDCGRNIKDNQTNNFFNELAVDHYLDAQWKNNPDNRDSTVGSMRRQLVCHFNIARNKPQWNLEPSRPYTSNEDSIAKGCNNI